MLQMKLAAFLLVLCCIVYVQGAPGNETALTSQAQDKRADQHRVVFNPGTGLFLNVYIETTIVPGQPDQTSVMGQILTTQGKLLSRSFPIWSYAATPDAQGRKSNPSAAFNDQDSIFLVVFEMERGGVPGLYGTFVSGDGLPRNYIFPLTNDTQPCVYPQVAYNPKANEFGVLWQVDKIVTNTSVGATSYLNMLTMNTTNFLAPIVVFGVPNYHNAYAFLTYVQAANLYLVVWSAADPTTDGIHDLFSLTVDSSGGGLFSTPPIVVVGVVEVNQTTQQGTHADSIAPFLIAYGGYYNLVWQVNGASGQEYTAAMYIDNNGVLASNLVSIGANYFYTRNPVGVYSAQGGVFVVLHEAGSSAAATNIIGITLDNNLNVLAYYSINSMYINNDHFPALAGDALNNNIAVWSHGDLYSPPPTTNTTGRSIKETTVPLQKFEDLNIAMGASKSELQARSKDLPFFSTADGLASPSFEPISSVAIKKREQEFLDLNVEIQEEAERASPPPPPSPAFLVGNPILVIPASSTTGSSGGGSKSNSDGWVGGLVAIILILIAIFVTSLVIIALLVYIAYKYRAQISAKMANLRLPSIPGRSSFTQFTDEDELS